MDSLLIASALALAVASTLTHCVLISGYVDPNMIDTLSVYATANFNSSNSFCNDYCFGFFNSNCHSAYDEVFHFCFASQLRYDIFGVTPDFDESRFKFSVDYDDDFEASDIVSLFNSSAELAQLTTLIPNVACCYSSSNASLNVGVFYFNLDSYMCMSSMPFMTASNMQVKPYGMHCKNEEQIQLIEVATANVLIQDMYVNGSLARLRNLSPAHSRLLVQVNDKAGKKD